LDTHHNDRGPPAEQIALRDRILERLAYDVGVPAARATKRDWFIAVALATRDRVVDQLRASVGEAPAKEVCYLSLEFLIGRLLSDMLGNLGLRDDMQAALAELGVDLDDVSAAEPDAALGNGGLGRLAACFMESMASVGIPAYGYGIRYEHGLFRQLIKEGEQMEAPEDWLSSANPWEFERRDLAFDVCFGGSADPEHGRAAWQPAETIRAVAYDTPVIGWRSRAVNTLRLWSARAVDPLRLADFNRGDHVGAHADRVRAEAISRVLYRGRAGASVAPGILFCIGFATGCAAAGDIAAWRCATAAGPCGGANERYAPGAGGGGAYAAAARCTPRAMGRCVGYRSQHAQLYQSHASAGSLGNLVACPGVTAAAAAYADHLRNQCAPPCPCGPAARQR
jgi:glucan phosphorylase